MVHLQIMKSKKEIDGVSVTGSLGRSRTEIISLVALRAS